ncbi:hypothetical protein LVJ83_11460 [Uruburuella testudinis]|uniref:Uncharacterized protein n=1 Tax=Uruburuella testudinis TaxID=1282863 RepID=A0ABY4DR77_9NEIS|nr:hypothetical protein [Uruburuella testudinis]UOO81535.1 hypothetical protein LVJ83_11460 [Uruburuella testudinis]
MFKTFLHWVEGSSDSLKSCRMAADSDFSCKLPPQIRLGQVATGIDIMHGMVLRMGDRVAAAD